jgi:hypothetical protein
MARPIRTTTCNGLSLEYGSFSHLSSMIEQISTLLEFSHLGALVPFAAGPGLGCHLKAGQEILFLSLSLRTLSILSLLPCSFDYLYLALLSDSSTIPSIFPVDSVKLRSTSHSYCRFFPYYPSPSILYQTLISPAHTQVCIMP